MGRAKRMTTYRDAKIIRNGDVTVVYGTTAVEPKGKAREDFLILANGINYMLYGGQNGTSAVTFTRGISRKYPEDAYDPKTGRIVASIKAELKGSEKAEEFLLKVKEVLKDCEKDIDVELARISARKEALKKVSF